LLFPISCLPDGLEKILSSPPGVGTPSVFKAQCGDGGGGDTMVLEDALLLDPVPVLGW
jgi:hypothetical protein